MLNQSLQYNGDMIRIDRLSEFFTSEYWEWDESGKITLDDISVAIHEAVPEVPDPYGDMWTHPVLEQKSRTWHIGRIIYFINNHCEIRDIELDNKCCGDYILPEPVIVDGWHRYAAAKWLNDQCKLFEIHCRYGGREDVLDYLRGITDICPID